MYVSEAVLVLISYASRLLLWAQVQGIVLQLEPCLYASCGTVCLCSTTILSTSSPDANILGFVEGDTFLPMKLKIVLLCSTFTVF